MNPRSKVQAGTFHLVAPLGTMELEDRAAGRLEKKPWDYQACAAIPHIGTVESLKACVELLRLQDEPPYIMVIDTGSKPGDLTELELMRDIDLEVHFIAGHGYQHSSEPVTAALDLAQSMCRSKHLLHIHSDCFLRRRDFISNFTRICNANTPVVGYKMSTREWAWSQGNWPTKDWEWMVGHVCTLLYMPSIHRAGATWSMQRGAHQYGYPWRIDVGWPDTECAFNNAIKDAGIIPLFIGFDQNTTRQIDDNIDHPRSYPGTRIYAGATNYRKMSDDWMAAALKDAYSRIQEWST